MANEPTTLEPGHYWVRFDGGVEHGFEVAYWSGQRWSILGTYGYGRPAHFQPIGARITPPQEEDHPP